MTFVIKKLKNADEKQNIDEYRQINANLEAESQCKTVYFYK